MTIESIHIDDLAAYVHSPRLVGNLPVGAPVLVEDEDGEQYTVVAMRTVPGRALIIDLGNPLSKEARIT